VEVEGALRAGPLVARNMKLETEDEARGLEFEGRVASVDSSAQTFLLVGRPDVFAYGSGTTVQPPGTLAQLRAGAKVELRGVLSGDGRRVEVTLLKFDD
jgi:hypothetical protein